MFRSKKTKTEFISSERYKDWSNAGHELEGIGTRLDAVRGLLKDIKDKDSWAYRHWSIIEQQMTTQWKMTLTLKDTGLKQVRKGDRYDIDYHFWEKSEEIGMPAFGFTVIDDWFNNIGLGQRIAASWEKARDEKIQKARQGLA